MLYEVITLTCYGTEPFWSLDIMQGAAATLSSPDGAGPNWHVGLRAIISGDEVTKVIDILKERDVKITSQTWNRRYREYMEKIKTGSVFEVAVRITSYNVCYTKLLRQTDRHERALPADHGLGRTRCHGGKGT